MTFSYMGWIFSTKSRSNSVGIENVRLKKQVYRDCSERFQKMVAKSKKTDKCGVERFSAEKLSKVSFQRFLGGTWRVRNIKYSISLSKSFIVIRKRLKAGKSLLWRKSTYCLVDLIIHLILGRWPTHWWRIWYHTMGKYIMDERCGQRFRHLVL